MQDGHPKINRIWSDPSLAQAADDGIIVKAGHVDWPRIESQASVVFDPRESRSDTYS